MKSQNYENFQNSLNYHLYDSMSSVIEKYQYLHCILILHNFEHQYSQLSFDFRSFQLLIVLISCHRQKDDVVFWRNNFIALFQQLKCSRKLKNFRGFIKIYLMNQY